MENANLGDNENPMQFSSPVNNAGSNQENYANDERRNSALHFFIYLFSFLSLLFVATGLGTILYQIINKIFPDAANGYSLADLFSQGAIKFGLASIIIAAPAYFLISFLITKYLYEGKILENSKVRKWITYIILFIASANILGDLISLVYNVLGGDMAARFVLKVLVILLIAGSIFGYYFWDMRKKNMMGVKYLGNKISATASIAVIVIVFIGSFFIVDSPITARNKQIDSITISRIQDYKYSIESYYGKNYSLPASLADIKESGIFGGINNNESINITYKTTGQFTYQLCANFKTSNLQVNKNDQYSYTDKNWQHDKGDKCFDQEISQSARRVNNPVIINSSPAGSAVAPAPNAVATTPNSVAPASSSGPAKGKCGDGICDAVEKASANLCPQDCK